MHTPECGKNCIQAISRFIAESGAVNTRITGMHMARNGERIILNTTGYTEKLIVNDSEPIGVITRERAGNRWRILLVLNTVNQHCLEGARLDSDPAWSLKKEFLRAETAGAVSCAGSNPPMRDLP